MARMDLRVRAWGWLTRRQASVAARSEDDVIAMQRRGMPENRMTTAELNAKFRSLAAAAVGADVAELLLSQLGNIFSRPSNTALLRHLGNVVVQHYSVPSAA